MTKTQSFGDKETPDVLDIDKFLKIIDTVSHNNHGVHGISEDRLEYWSDGRKLDLHVYPYGTSVQTKAQWTAIHKGQNALVPNVVTDKAGSATEEEIEALVERLKDIHRFHYTAPHITWRAWADWILKKKS